MSKHTRLNEQQVATVKQRYEAGDSLIWIAKSMKISRQLAWYHVKAKPRRRLTKSARAMLS